MQPTSVNGESLNDGRKIFELLFCALEKFPSVKRFLVDKPVFAENFSWTTSKPFVVLFLQLFQVIHADFKSLPVVI